MGAPPQRVGPWAKHGATGGLFKVAVLGTLVKTKKPMRIGGAKFSRGQRQHGAHSAAYEELQTLLGLRLWQGAKVVTKPSAVLIDQLTLDERRKSRSEETSR